jgi:hypothetical protein
MKNIIKSLGVISTVAMALSALTAFAAVSAGVNVAVTSALINSTSSASSNSIVGASVNAPITTSANVNVDSGKSSSTSDSTAVDSSIQAVLNSNSNVSKVETSDNSVSVWYKESGKFLGFIPVTISTKASADASGKAKISHPWYDFLTVTDDSAAQTQLQSKVAGQASANGQLSDSAKVSLINTIHSAIQVWMSSSASTNASASY